MNWWFDSWSAFVAMGGYGAQVWLCVLLLLLSLVWMLLVPLLQRRSALAAPESASKNRSPKQ